MTQTSKTNDPREPWEKPFTWLNKKQLGLRRLPLWRRFKCWERHLVLWIANCVNYQKHAQPWPHRLVYMMQPGEWIFTLNEAVAEVFDITPNDKEEWKKTRDRVWQFLHRMQGRGWWSVSRLKVKDADPKKPDRFTNDGCRLALRVPKNVRHLFFDTPDSDEARASQADSKTSDLPFSTPGLSISTPCSTPMTPIIAAPVAAKTHADTKRNSVSNSTPLLGLEAGTASKGSVSVSPGSPVSPDSGFASLSLKHLLLTVSASATSPPIVPVACGVRPGVTTSGQQLQECFNSSRASLGLAPVSVSEVQIIANRITARRLDLESIVADFFNQDSREDFSVEALDGYVSGIGVW